VRTTAITSSQCGEVCSSKLFNAWNLNTPKIDIAAHFSVGFAYLFSSTEWLYRRVITPWERKSVNIPIHLNDNRSTDINMEKVHLMHLRAL